MLKEIGLALYLVPIWVIIWCLGKLADISKSAYKKFHAAATTLSVHADKIVDENN